MKKQMIAAVLSVGMVLSVTACGAGTSSETAGNTAEETPAEDTEAEDTEAAKTTETAEENTVSADSETEADAADAGAEDDTIMLVQTTFVEERAGKDQFESFDEIIDQLKEGEGYAYIDIAGYGGSECGQQILAVTDGTYSYDENTNAAISVCLYATCGYVGGYTEGTPMNIGNVQTGGTAYPIRLSEDGQLYVCNNRTYGILQVSDADLLYYTEKIDITYSEDGTGTISGFTSENGDMINANHDIDVATEDEFYALYDGLEDIPPIHFTVVGAK